MRKLTDLEVSILNETYPPLSPYLTDNQVAIYLSEGREWLLDQWLTVNQGCRETLCCVLGDDTRFKSFNYTVDQIARFTMVSK